MTPMRTPLFSPGLMPQNSGIASLLHPIIRVVSEDYKQDVVDPYIQEVEQLTTRTFPEVQFGMTRATVQPSIGSLSDGVFQPIPGSPQIGVGGLFSNLASDSSPATPIIAFQGQGIPNALGPLVR